MNICVCGLTTCPAVSTVVDSTVEVATVVRRLTRAHLLHPGVCCSSPAKSSPSKAQAADAALFEARARKKDELQDRKKREQVGSGIRRRVYSSCVICRQVRALHRDKPMH